MANLPLQAGALPTIGQCKELFKLRHELKIASAAIRPEGELSDIPSGSGGTIPTDPLPSECNVFAVSKCVVVIIVRSAAGSSGKQPAMSREVQRLQLGDGGDLDDIPTQREPDDHGASAGSSGARANGGAKVGAKRSRECCQK